MDTKASYVAAGTFVISLFIGCILFVLWLNKVDWTEGKFYDIYFSGSTTGLRTNELVSYNGVPIGRVESIGVAPERINLIRVTVEIDNPDIIRENSYATLEAKGITGAVQVRIQGTTPDSPRLKANPGEPHPVIQSRNSSFQAVLERAPQIIEKVAVMLDNISPFFSEGNLDSFSKSMENIRTVSANLAEQSQKLEELFDAAHQSFAVLGKAGDTVDKSMEKFNQLIEENRPYLLKFSQKGLEDTPPLLESIKDTSESLNRILNKLEPNPTGYLLNQSNLGERVPE